MFNLQAVRQWLNEKTVGLHHRQLLIIELPLNDSLSILEEINKCYKHVSVMANEFTHFTAATNIHIAKYQKYLGSETNALIFDASSGINLNALYAGIGMVQSNGIVAVILKGQKVFSNGTLKFSYGQQDSYSYFTELFKNRVLQSNGCIVNSTLSILPSAQISGRSLDSLGANDKHCEKRPNSPNIELSAEQAKIANDVIDRVTAKREVSKCVSIILGARGRGKSTLLGVIAAKLKQYEDLQQTRLPLATCALHRNQLHNANLAFTNESHFISNHLDTSESSQNINKIDDSLAFYAPDEIISLAPLNSIVLLDEIASLAPELVKKIVNHFSIIIITGTSSGYEGSGSGFVQRLLPFIHNVKSTIVYELKMPFRWLPGDHIESCFGEILSAEVNFSLKKPDNLYPQIFKDIRFRIVEKKELKENVDLYRQLVALLTQAHYQTTPNDIVRIMDASDCEIFIGENTVTTSKTVTTTIIAVAITFIEGGCLLEPIANDISIGKRRVQGHLSAQALSLHLFSPKPCINSYLRINRIAVVSQHSRKGIASALLNYCEEYACKNHIDYMSVSFGFTQGLYRFWSNNDYYLAKIGQRIDTASGAISLLMIKDVSKTGNIKLTELIARNSLDVNYYSNTRVDMFDFVTTLEVSNNLKTDIHVLAMLQTMLSLYINKEINFQKFAPALLAIINFKSEFFNREQLASIQEVFKHLHTKGVHKEIKETLEASLFTHLHGLAGLSKQ
jgi:tRNA(Met) cytidine acetyltransferase